MEKSSFSLHFCIELLCLQTYQSLLTQKCCITRKVSAKFGAESVAVLPSSSRLASYVSSCLLHNSKKFKNETGFKLEVLPCVHVALG
jgi:hypothetical protein